MYRTNFKHFLSFIFNPINVPVEAPTSPIPPTPGPQTSTPPPIAETPAIPSPLSSQPDDNEGECPADNLEVCGRIKLLYESSTLYLQHLNNYCCQVHVINIKTRMYLLIPIPYNLVISAHQLMAHTGQQTKSLDRRRMVFCTVLYPTTVLHTSLQMLSLFHHRQLCLILLSLVDKRSSQLMEICFIEMS